MSRTLHIGIHTHSLSLSLLRAHSHSLSLFLPLPPFTLSHFLILISSFPLFLSLSLSPPSGLSGVNSDVLDYSVWSNTVMAHPPAVMSSPSPSPSPFPSPSPSSFQSSFSAESVNECELSRYVQMLSADIQRAKVVTTVEDLFKLKKSEKKDRDALIIYDGNNWQNLYSLLEYFGLFPCFFSIDRSTPRGSHRGMQSSHLSLSLSLSLSPCL